MEMDVHPAGGDLGGRPSIFKVSEVNLELAAHSGSQEGKADR